jgi:hypothetical protein
MPGGAEYYAYLVRHFTTLDRTPEEIHAVGLEEVRRIRSEMEQVIRRTGFSGTFAEFLQFLRTDPRFYAKTPQELLSRASRVAKAIDGKLPLFFGRLPRLPYAVEPVPAEIAPKYTGGRYVPASPGGKKAGTYWVNTYDLPSRPLYVLPSLTLGLVLYGEYTLIVRSAMLETLGEDYVLTARAKGLSNWAIVRKHGLRNAMLPIVTLIALSLGFIVGGAITVEYVFDYPGIGLAIVDAIDKRDYTFLQGAFLLLTISVILFNFLADLLYFKLDPRVTT